MTMGIPSIKGVLAITNSHASEVRLTLEPWADEHMLPPDSTVEVAFNGPMDGRIEVEMKPGEIIVYGWEGAVMSVLDSPRNG